jgi:hypothetical protein
VGAALASVCLVDVAQSATVVADTTDDGASLASVCSVDVRSDNNCVGGNYK